jgi:Calpain family cysteine protease
VEKNGTLSATDLADLQTLVANASFLGMPGYVQDLANKVINGNPANALYQGEPLGNLAVGSSALQLQDLVNKWFLGLDYPVAVAGTTYAYAAGTLFGSSGPLYTDVVQGDVGDCYFCAALAELAAADPAAIRSMFINNGDGTFTVRFYDNGVPDYVTVNRYFPELSNGTFFYANWWDDSLSNSSNVLWVALAEKAYAELAASGWSRPDAVNSYNALTNGWEGMVLYQVANVSATSQTLASNSATETAILNALAAGQMIGLDSNASTAAPVINDHVYALISYNPKTQTFLTYNPWGYTQTFTWAQIEANFGFWSDA